MVSQDGASLISSCLSVCQSCGPQSLGLGSYKSSGLSQTLKSLDNIGDGVPTVLRYRFGWPGSGGLARLYSDAIDIINQVSLDLVMGLIKRSRRNSTTGKLCKCEYYLG